LERKKKYLHHKPKLNKKNMKTEYGSQNQEEESAFIRRVVAPPKRDAKRSQKRAAAVGASLALFAAGAVCTYVALPSEQNVSTQTLNAENGNFVIPVEEEEEGETVEHFLPAFIEYDTNEDGVISTQEYINRLITLRDEALGRVAESDLSPADKKSLSHRLIKNVETETGCVIRLSARDRKANGAVTKERWDLFYNLIKEFCILEDVKIPEVFRPTEHPSEPPVFEPATEAPVAPVYEPETNQPHFEPIQEPINESPVITPAHHEPATEAPYVPAWEEPATEAPHVPAWE
jgi:hypothetical protein